MQALLKYERDARAILGDNTIHTKFKLGAIRIDVGRGAALFVRVNIPIAAWTMIAAAINHEMSDREKHGRAGGVFPATSAAEYCASHSLLPVVSSQTVSPDINAEKHRLAVVCGLTEGLLMQTAEAGSLAEARAGGHRADRSRPGQR